MGPNPAPPSAGGSAMAVGESACGGEEDRARCVVVWMGMRARALPSSGATRREREPAVAVHPAGSTRGAALL